PDDVGAMFVQQFAQSIHLPLTSSPARNSTNIVYETRAGANSRVWLVNQDNDSVSVFDAVTNARLQEIAVGAGPRSIAIAPDGRLWVTSKVGTSMHVLSPATLAVAQTTTLAPGALPVGIVLASAANTAVVAPARSGANLTFQNTVRAISSRIDRAAGTEDYAHRIDHDNSSVAAATVFDPNGIYVFVALETSREVAVVDAYASRELFRFNVGRAPQGLAISPDGLRLYVSNFMDRTLGIFDVSDLTTRGQWTAVQIGTLTAIATEKLAAPVLTGKQLFYDARDTRLARDSYMSCASCHNDGGQDGRVWDLTGMGEGLRNTINLRGPGATHGRQHRTCTMARRRHWMPPSARTPVSS